MSFEKLIEKVELCAKSYQMSTGFSPNRIYLGQKEVATIKGSSRLTYNNSDGTCNMVVGLRIFEVLTNEPHIRCAR